MSSLTLLKLQRELELTRRALAGETERPRIEMQWRIDPASGRPVRSWVAVPSVATPTLVRMPDFV